MAGRPTYDTELLRRLLKEHPDWTYAKMAEVLTDDNTKRGQPHKVSGHTVATRVAAFRVMETAGDIALRPPKPPSNGLVVQLSNNVGVRIPTDKHPQQYLQLLRLMDRKDNGLPLGKTESTREKNFRRKLYTGRLVVDLKPDGTAYLRAAAPWELTHDNKLIRPIACWRPEGLNAPDTPAPPGSLLPEP